LDLPWKQRADHPGDANLPPEESVACRCVVVFLEAEEERQPPHLPEPPHGTRDCAD
jgi:hypothetical protein